MAQQQPIITAAAPGNAGLTVTTIEDLEREAELKRRALDAANEVLNPNPLRRRLRMWAGRLRWRGIRIPLLILACLPACEGPLHLVDAGTDLEVADLAASDAAHHSPCDELPGGACLLCEDDQKDCRPAAPPECTSCSWTEPLNCLPSLCMEFRYGVKCCAAAPTTVIR